MSKMELLEMSPDTLFENFDTFFKFEFTPFEKIEERKATTKKLLQEFEINKHTRSNSTSELLAKLKLRVFDEDSTKKSEDKENLDPNHIYRNIPQHLASKPDIPGYITSKMSSRGLATSKCVTNPFQAFKEISKTSRNARRPSGNLVVVPAIVPKKPHNNSLLGNKFGLLKRCLNSGQDPVKHNGYKSKWNILGIATNNSRAGTKSIDANSKRPRKRHSSTRQQRDGNLIVGHPSNKSLLEANKNTKETYIELLKQKRIMKGQSIVKSFSQAVKDSSINLLSNLRKNERTENSTSIFSKRGQSNKTRKKSKFGLKRLQSVIGAKRKDGSSFREKKEEFSYLEKMRDRGRRDRLLGGEARTKSKGAFY